VSETFGAAASRLAGLAGVLLGWRPQDFWAATPAELAAVLAVMGGATPSDDPLASGDLARLMELFPDG
jgi:hypothetical protein